MNYTLIFAITILVFVIICYLVSKQESQLPKVLEIRKTVLDWSGKFPNDKYLVLFCNDQTNPEIHQTFDRLGQKYNISHWGVGKYDAQINDIPYQPKVELRITGSDKAIEYYGDYSFESLDQFVREHNQNIKRRE